MKRTNLAGLILILTTLACNAPAATPGITEIMPLPNTPVATEPATVTAASPAATSVPATPAAGGLTLDQIKNTTYSLEMLPSGAAILVDGHYQEPNPQLGGDTAVDLVEPLGYGDVNGDGIQDALVRLILQTGSTTGHFSFMCAMLNQNGTPIQAACTSLGDRIILNSMAVAPDGLITVDMIVAGPNDGMCCPNTPAVRTFRLEGTSLVEYINGATATPFVPPIDYAMLQNMTYHDVQQPGDSFTLVGGTSSQVTSNGTLTVNLENWIVPGDLDADGMQDVVSVLKAHTETTTGYFFFLVAVRNNHGTPEHVATAYLGDPVIVNIITIDSGIITVDMMTVGPNDGACCPNTPTTKRYRLEGTQLVPVE